MDSLVTEEDILRSKGLIESVVATLLSNKKPNTRAIHRKMWKKCIEHERQYMDTPSILEFLQQGADKGLALSTLKVQIAALSLYLERH